MRASAIHEHLRGLNGGWVDPDRTVDRWKAGDPEVEVTGVAVAWMSYTWALERARELGCNLFITHEPTYYHHEDEDPRILEWPECVAKRRRIEELGVTILRCHDLWDRFPDLGIPDSWGRKLGLGDALAGEGYFRVYDGRSETADTIARRVADRVRDMGQEAVELVGPPERRIGRIVLGTGAATPYRYMLLKYEADLVICSDDGFRYWRDGAHAIDGGHNVVVVHHQVSEEHGMERLAEHLRERFSGVPVHYIPQRCMYRLVAAPPR